MAANNDANPAIPNVVSLYQKLLNENEDRYQSLLSQMNQAVATGAPSPLLQQNIATVLYQDMSTEEREQFVMNFLQAGRCGNLSKVQECVRSGVDVEIERGDSWRVLHYASSGGHLEVVKYLVEQCHVDTYARTNGGWTSLHFASVEGHLEVVRYFVHDCHVDVSTKSDEGCTALHGSCEKDQLLMLRYLIQECHVDVNTKSNNGCTALHSAAQNGSLSIVQYLIHDCHVDVNIKANDGTNALHLASFGGQLDVVRFLLADCHVDVTAKDLWDDTAYDFAKRRNHFEVAAFLKEVANRIQQNSQQNELSMNSSSNHLVEDFVAAAGDGDINKLNQCIHSGVDVEAQNSTAWKALHYACFQGRLHIVNFLLEKCGANVEATDCNGRTALHIASKNGHLDIARYLIDNCSVDLEATDNVGINALHFASYYGHLNIVQYLVEKCDFDTSSTTMWGVTAHQIAMENQEITICEYLKKQPIKEKPKVEARLQPTPHKNVKKLNDNPEIGTDRQNMETLINDPEADPVVLSLKYLEMCTDNFTTKVLGEGAFGKVYLGCDKELGIRIAVKRINLQVPDQDTLDEITLSFKREIAVLKRFRHPNIVVMYGYNVLVKHNNQFLVYEYLSNGSLATFWKDEKCRTRLPSNVRLSIMFQLARSVHFLHTGGCDNLTVLHRDIKSGNICLTQDYTAKLIDCGLAKFVPDSVGDRVQGSVTPTMLKSSGAAVFGTPGYICPVYSRGQTPFTTASDVFSVGVVIVELLVGSLQGGQSTQARQNLGDFFCRYIKDDEDEPVENGWMSLMQDADIAAEWNDEILQRLCKIATQCMAASPKRRLSTFSLVQNLSEISSYDFTIVGDTGSESIGNDSSNAPPLLSLNDSPDARKKVEGTEKSDVPCTSCVLCNRLTRNNVSCVDGHQTCVQCVEQEIQVQMGKSGDIFRCKCGSLVHDSALFGCISISTYNCYIRERSLQKVIEEKFDGMKTHLHRISSMSEKNYEQVMTSIQGISSNIQRVLGGLAYVATNSVQQCPTVVWLVPADRTSGISVNAWKQWGRNLTHKKYDVCFVCQHSFEVVDTKMTITVPRSWMIQAAPVLCLSIFLLKTALTIGGLPALPFPIPNLSRADQLTMNEEFMADFLDDATTKLIDTFKAVYTQGSDLPYSESSQLLSLTGASYEGIVAKTTNMKQSHWKQIMEPVTNHRGSIIWIKKEYCGFY